MFEEVIKLEPDLPIFISRSDPSKLKKSKPGLISRMHLHREYEFLEITKGSLLCVTIDNKLTVNEGDILFLNTHTPHSTYSLTEYMQANLLQFRLPSEYSSILHYVARFLRSSDTPTFVFKSEDPVTEEIRAYMDTIIKEYSEKKPFRNDYIKANMQILIAALKRAGVLSASLQSDAEKLKKIRPVLEYVEANYASDISTADLCRLLSFNETYFCKLFRETVGTTPVNYINFVRVCKAERLLREDLSLSKIADSTGFSSLSYFNRTFKKFNHYSPSEYKKIVKNREMEY